MTVTQWISTEIEAIHLVCPKQYYFKPCSALNKPTLFSSLQSILVFADLKSLLIFLNSALLLINSNTHSTSSTAPLSKQAISSIITVPVLLFQGSFGFILLF